MGRAYNVIDADGIDAAFLYPSLGLFSGAIQDPPLAAAVCHRFSRGTIMG